MDLVLLALAMAAGYLSGSVLYAVVVTKAVTGQDIRTIGNSNPGTSNVARTVGKPWGALVCFLDAGKGLAPLIVAKLLLYPDGTAADLGRLYLVGIAAVVGHCRPVFYGFKGGGGIGTMLGVSLFFVPVEFAASLLVGGLVAITFFSKAEHTYAQWTPIMFVILTPFVTLATSLFLNVPLLSHVSIGGHPWTVVAGTFVLSLLLLWLNGSFMTNRAAEFQGIKGR